MSSNLKDTISGSINNQGAFFHGLLAQLFKNGGAAFGIVTDNLTAGPNR